jgi:hypothetical protein
VCPAQLRNDLLLLRLGTQSLFLAGVGETMNTAKRISFGFVLFLLALPSVTAQSGATKDPQALSVLNACISASGGNQALTGIQDFVVSGTVTFYWDQPTQAPAVLKERGNQFRFDATLGTGTRSWAVNNGIGVLVNADGSRTTFTSRRRMV